MTDKNKLHKVVDSSCTLESPLRHHEIQVNGEWYKVKFEFGKDTLLPFDKAAKFLLPGFTVTDADGTELALPVAKTDASIAALNLASDEVVAKLSELTLESLKIRAAAKKGGEMFLEAPNTARPDLIAFLLNKAPVPAASGDTTTTIDLEENLLEDDGEGDGNPDSTLGTPGNPTLPPAQPPAAPATPAAAAVKPAVVDIADLKDGDKIPAGTVIVNEKGTAAEKEPENGAAETQATYTLDEIKAATDEALALAAQYGIDLKPYHGKGSGENGNILKDDVQGLIDHHKLQPVKKAE